ARLPGDWQLLCVLRASAVSLLGTAETRKTQRGARMVLVGPRALRYGGAVREGLRRIALAGGRGHYVAAGSPEGGTGVPFGSDQVAQAYRADPKTTGQLAAGPFLSLDIYP